MYSFQYDKFITNDVPGTHVNLKMRGFCLYNREYDIFQIMHWSPSAHKELCIGHDYAGYIAEGTLSELIPFCEKAGFIIDSIDERSDYAKKKQKEWDLHHKEKLKES